MKENMRLGSAGYLSICYGCSLGIQLTEEPFQSVDRYTSVGQAKRFHPTRAILPWLCEHVLGVIGRRNTGPSAEPFEKSSAAGKWRGETASGCPQQR